MKLKITLTEKEIEEIAHCGAACYRRIEAIKRGDHSEHTVKEALQFCNDAYEPIRKKVVEFEKRHEIITIKHA